MTFDSSLGYNAPVTLLIHFYTMPLIQLLLLTPRHLRLLIIPALHRHPHVLLHTPLQQRPLPLQRLFRLDLVPLVLECVPLVGGYAPFVVGEGFGAEEDGFCCGVVEEVAVVGDEEDRGGC